MANFPKLKTGALAQYPLELATAFPTHSVRFLDGSRQSYRLYGTGLRRWVIKLDLLDEQELSALITFAQLQKSATFVFTDPASGSNVANCIISGDEFEAILHGEARGSATVTIEETA